MRRTILILAAVLSSISFQFARAASDAEVAAHRSALDLAGAFSNEEFKLRDGHQLGEISVGKPVTIQVSLFAGNEYWFSVGATDKVKKLAVRVYDETGKLMEVEPYQEGSQAAAGFSPDVSGPYYIRIEEIEGDAATFCFLYSYK